MQHLTDETRAALVRRLEHAHEKHGRVKSPKHALNQILEGCSEFRHVMLYGEDLEVYERLLDVATVAIRYAEQLKREGVV